jgi:hypothetical protein
MFSNCPYGEYHRVKGYSRRARAYHSFISGAREKFKGTPSLNQVSGDLVAVVGDYVYLPLHYLDNMVNPMKIGLVQKHFIRKEALTPELIITLCGYRPQALFGGEIRDYQEKHVPIFLRGLRDRLPSLLDQAIEIDPSIKTRVAKVTNVGRKAILESLKPNVGSFVDIHGAHWSYDGQYITSKDSHVGFALVYKIAEVRILPVSGQEVKVTDDAQVTDITVFTD